MSEWKIHLWKKKDDLYQYKCGLRAGQFVRLKKDLVIRDHEGNETDVIPKGEKWKVLIGTATDPVLWFRQANGDRHTWDDNIQEVNEWFEVVE